MHTARDNYVYFTFLLGTYGRGKKTRFLSMYYNYLYGFYFFLGTDVKMAG